VSVPCVLAAPPYAGWMRQWFGEPWPTPDRRAEVCADDALRIDTPVGEMCVECDEAVVAGDRGYRMASVAVSILDSEVVDAEAELVIVHAECLLRSMLGGPAHQQELCSCYRGDDGVEDPDLGMSPRDAARAVWDAVMDAAAGQWTATTPEDQRVARATLAAFRGNDEVREAARWN
jgi:hypothetical protein